MQALVQIDFLQNGTSFSQQADTMFGHLVTGEFQDFHPQSNDPKAEAAGWEGRRVQKCFVKALCVRTKMACFNLSHMCYSGLQHAKMQVFFYKSESAQH